MTGNIPGLPYGVTAADLYGLTPEEIQSVMSIEAEADKMRLGTIGMVEDILQGRKPEAVEPPEQWETLQDEKGRMFRRNRTTNRLELVAGRLEPDENFTYFFDRYGRRIKENLTTGEQTQVTGPVPSEPTTAEERMALAKTQPYPSGDWWKNPDSGDITWVDRGDDPPFGYTQRVPSREREVSDLAERRFAETVAGNVRRATELIKKHKEKPAVQGDIDYVNRYSIGTSGFIWLEQRRPGPLKDIKEATEVKLPKVRVEGVGEVQVTMKDVRAIAEKNGISVEEVLRVYHEKSKRK